MATKRPTTIAEYIQAAPSASHAHLHKLYAILKSVAPEAEEVIKWGNPFFVEPRFVFSFSAHKAHCNFAPMITVMDVFSQELAAYKTTKNFLQIPYKDPMPEELIRNMAEYCLRTVNTREDTGFW